MGGKEKNNSHGNRRGRAPQHAQDEHEATARRKRDPIGRSDESLIFGFELQIVSPLHEDIIGLGSAFFNA